MPVVPTRLLEPPNPVRDAKEAIYRMAGDKHTVESIAAACTEIVKTANPGINVDVDKLASMIELNKRKIADLNESRLISRSQIRRIIAEEISKLY